MKENTILFEKWSLVAKIIDILKLNTSWTSELENINVSLGINEATTYMKKFAIQIWKK